MLVEPDSPGHAADLTGLASARVLLVGGAGFLGRHVGRRLSELGADVWVLDPSTPSQGIPQSSTYVQADVTTAEGRDLVTDIPWDFVVNVAGTIDQRHDPNTDRTMFDQHVHHVRRLTSLLRHPLQRFVHAGSAVEYGDNPTPHHEGLRERPLTPYAAAKVATTHYLFMLAHSGRLPAVVLRPFMIYGLGQSANAFFSSTIKTALEGGVLRITPGAQTRDPVSVTDVTEAFVRACVIDAAVGHVINVGCGQPWRVLDLAQLIVETVGAGSVAAGALDYRTGEMMQSHADTRRLQTLLGLQPGTDLQHDLAVLAEALRTG